jgi:hypothetical protein
MIAAAAATNTHHDFIDVSSTPRLPCPEDPAL